MSILTKSYVLNFRNATVFSHMSCCHFTSKSEGASPNRKYKLLIIGGGTGGTSIASIFSKKLKNDVAVVEPKDIHYYQSMFTLVGGGLRQFYETQKPTKSVLPKDVTWIKDTASKFDPQNNIVETKNGDKIGYDYLVLTLGLQLNYSSVKGLEEALATDPNVVSTYSPKYVEKVLPAVDNITDGVALFTFPITPVKCAGAGQKICYLSEERVANSGLRNSVQFKYHTALPVIFPVPRYAEVLDKYAEGRNIEVKKCRNLIEVRGAEKEAVFDVVGENRQEVEKYSLLHVTPPMSTPSELWGSPLVDETNFVTVDRDTLQHVKYPNIFALGDCTNAPTSKTAAACSSQVGVASKNLEKFMQGQSLPKKYNGYTSCPLTVSRSKVILAEFGYDGQILETFPVDQRKPRRLMFFLKATVLPVVYWSFMLKGLWRGPSLIRKILRLGM